MINDTVDIVSSCLQRTETIPVIRLLVLHKLELVNHGLKLWVVVLNKAGWIMAQASLPAGWLSSLCLEGGYGV